MATLRTISGFSFSSRSRLSLLLKISRLNIDPTSFFFTLNKRSSKAFIYLTFIIYYISQKRSRDLTLIDQYFLECKNTLKHQGAILTSNIKLLTSRDLLEVPLPKRRSQPSTRSKDFLCQKIHPTQNGDELVSFERYVSRQTT